jgi:hypothetical protein
MEEDRGAFKTNPRNPAHFRHFVIGAGPENTRIAGGFASRFEQSCGRFGRHFCSRRQEADCCILDSA